jgi:uncharacterized repeat protein (TIGR01451 family)
MSKLLKWFSLIILLLLAYFDAPSAQIVKAQQSNQPLIESDETGLTITWTPPDYVVSTITVDGALYSRLEMPGLTLSGRPGYPQLPFYSGLIGLPGSGEARLEIVELKTELAQLPNPPIPAPVPQPVHLSPTDINPATLAGGGPTLRIPEPAIYAADSFYPTGVAELARPQQVRDHRLASLTINPVRVNPVSRTIEVVRSLRLRITFTQPATTISVLSSPAALDPFASALGVTLLNPEAGQWVAPLSVPDTELGSQSLDAQATTGLIKVSVKEVGLYALTYTDLQSAGLPVDSLDPRTLKLSYGYPRQEIAILVEGETDGRFNASDRLLFYAALKSSRYGDDRVYFLSYNGANGLRMGSRSGAPGGLSAGTAWRTTTAETNKFYDPLYQASDGDYWYWDKLSQPDQTSKSYAIQLQSPLVTGPAASLKVWLQGYTSSLNQNPDHRLRFYFNNTSVGAVEWDGKTAYTASLTIPSGYLTAGANQVRLTLPGISGVFAEGVWLDAISLTYPTNQAEPGQTHFKGEAGQKKYILTGVGSAPLVFDITMPDAPRRVTNYNFNSSTLTVGDSDPATAAYLIVPGNQVKKPLSLQPASLLSDPAGGADYIIITPSSLASAVAPLAARRANQGLRVKTVNVQAIYDTYGSGRMEAEAIKTFLTHAYQNWPAPAPLYVLLVGDGSYDFKNYSGYNPQTLLPPYLAQVDPWWGETASDNRLVTLAGNDNLPDMLIGRLSVSSAAETSAVVNKIIQYETNPPGGFWNVNQLFIADDPDQAGSFHLSADQVYNQSPASYLGYRYYYDDGGGQPYVYSNPGLLQADFLNAFNNGASFVTFYGHSSWEQWAVESFLHLNDFGQLNNQNRLPVISEMTCFTGFFHHPKTTTFDESMLRSGSGGAVAIWGSTGLGVGTGHDKLQEGFYEAIMGGQPILGAAIMAGKLKLFATGFHQDLLDTFTLFGDPALNLSKIFKPDLRISQTINGSDHQPGDPVTFTLTIQNTGAGPVTGIVVTDNLPSAILSPGWSTATAGVSASGTYLWTLPDLAPYETVVITVSGTIDPSLPPDFSLINRAGVTGAVSELSLNNNTSVAIVGGQRIYLPIIMSQR